MNFGTEYNRDSVETKIGNEGEELILGQLQSFLPKPFYLFKKIKTNIEKCENIISQYNETIKQKLEINNIHILFKGWNKIVYP